MYVYIMAQRAVREETFKSGEAEYTTPNINVCDTPSVFFSEVGGGALAHFCL